MYTPGHFRVENRADITAVIRANRFATLVTTGQNGLAASHLPFLYEESSGPHGKLIAHMARANEQWRDFSASVDVLVIFQGEHGYISPTWLATQPSVPTWNYEIVHAYGTPQLVEDGERVADLLDATVRAYEPGDSSYQTKHLPAGYVEKMSKAIVAFEIPVTRLEAKFKLSQNRSRQDVQGVIQALEKSNDPSSLRLAASMRRENRVLLAD